ncbi:unnamed protein product [Allacma fusca]|uniref:Uncharacterized protein n=1 Tax=Allacma fusca TaxID=39272 RepID=A0A8J2LJM0_9HEXA|nr:unnamed protein product [Allacma fusca]
MHSSSVKPTLCGGHVKSIGTHNGKFHCDEVLACSMLKELPEYSDAEIIRTRDEEILKTCDIVVDVGGVYDPEKLRFDHHQKTFTESMSTLRPGCRFTTKLSSAGLVYHHFGLAVIARILDKKESDEVVQELYEKMYENFIEEIDAVDNGIPLNDFPMRYRINTTLSQRVGALNSSWRDPHPDELQGFQTAMQLVGKELKEKIHHYATDWWEAFSNVKTAVENRFEVDSSGEIMELVSGGCPWKEHLVKLENDLEIETPIKFVIFPDNAGAWRVQAVPKSPDSFLLKVPLLPAWQGLRDKELQEASGLPTAIFVHANGFIGGAHERQNAIQMARVSLGKAV